MAVTTRRGFSRTLTPNSKAENLVGVCEKLSSDKSLLDPCNNQQIESRVPVPGQTEGGNTLARPDPLSLGKTDMKGECFVTLSSGLLEQSGC